MAKINKTEVKEEVVYSDLDAKEFERRLDGRSFVQYCTDEGFWIVNKQFPRGAVSKNKLAEYMIARNLNKVLDNLKERRYFAKKQEHLDNLGGEVCDCEQFCKSRVVKPVQLTPPPSAFEIMMNETMPEVEFVDVTLKDCPKCFNLLEDCVCIKLEDIPF